MSVIPLASVIVAVTLYVPLDVGLHEIDGEFMLGHPGGRPV